jgi:hypothetical protein
MLMRTSPAGGNRRNVSVLVKSCPCGSLQSIHPEKLNYFERRWIQRVNKRSESYHENEDKDFSDWEHDISCVAS